MSVELLDRLASGASGSIVAPAGYGKTQLISNAVKAGRGRQLLLTHTHAGVRSLRSRLARLGVEESRFRVATIDSWALRYARAFRQTSGWGSVIPAEKDWPSIRVGAAMAIRLPEVGRVVRRSYDGVYVDEYQDCSRDQHHLVSALAELLPCRVLGDPLQSLFHVVDPTSSIRWTDVIGRFPLLGELRFPMRWAEKNPALGEWLASVRQKLQFGEPLDLRDGPGIYSGPVDALVTARTCLGLRPPSNERVVVVRNVEAGCHHLGRRLNGAYRVIERVDCPDLLRWAGALDRTTGHARALVILEALQACFARLNGVVRRMESAHKSGRITRTTLPGYLELAQSLSSVAAADDFRAAAQAMDAAERIRGPVLWRDEPWRDLRCLLRSDRAAGVTLRDLAWSLRDMRRRSGRALPPRSIGTPLRIKGLEFEHAIVVDATEHGQAEALYVALTRGSRSLRVFAKTPIVRLERPANTPESAHAVP